MAAFSAKNGNVKQGNTDITDVLDWTLDDMVEEKKYCSSDTSGRRTTLAGPGHVTGTLTYLGGSTGAVQLLAGTSYTLHLYEDGSRIYDIVAIVGKSTPTVNIDDGGPVRYQCSFSEVSGFTRPT